MVYFVSRDVLRNFAHRFMLQKRTFFRVWWTSENSSVGRAQPCQGWGREFESRFSLNRKPSSAGGFFFYPELPQQRMIQSKTCITMHAKITTDRGTMTVEFFENDAPKTVANFVKLAKEGFYNGLKFHRVIPGFVAQGGCPDGIGSGGPGYSIDCELDGENQYHDLGVLSMAHAGRNTGGSQFFLVHSRDSTAHLDRNHTCFGKVTEGVDIVTQIKEGDTFSVEVVED